jgi:GT2 family glycosyltransferase
MVKVFAIIVTYNGIKWIEECIQSLLNSNLKVSIIIVDNNSSDKTVSFIKEKYNEDVFLIESKENLGFGKGNNLGLSYALKNGADYVFLLNQDAFIEKDTLVKLVEVANNNPEFGIISPIHLNAEGTALEAYFSSFVDRSNSPSFYSDFVLHKKIAEIYETKFVNAAAWLIPKKTLSEVGGFDPIFNHYGEDDNYCQRIKFHGYKIGVVPNAFIRHDCSIRTFPENYLFSDKFYIEYVKFLQVKYANINIPLSYNVVSYEKKKVGKSFIENCLNGKCYKIGNYYKQYMLIDITFVEIIKSRKINEQKSQHYI